MLKIVTYPPDANIPQETLRYVFDCSPKTILVEHPPEVTEDLRDLIIKRFPSDYEIIIRPSDSVTHVILQRMDDILSDIVSRHVTKIFENGYAKRIDGHDFFHGHCKVGKNTVRKKVNILMPKRSTYSEYRKFADAPESMTDAQWIEFFLNSEPFFIYHTQEYIGPRRPYTGPPRSIMGDIRGNVYPMKSEEEVFITHGSVGGDERFECNGITYDGLGVFETTVISKPDGITPYSADVNQFYVLEDPEGRYVAPNGQSFDSYFQLLPIEKP